MSCLIHSRCENRYGSTLPRRQYRAGSFSHAFPSTATTLTFSLYSVFFFPRGTVTSRTLFPSLISLSLSLSFFFSLSLFTSLPKQLYPQGLCNQYSVLGDSQTRKISLRNEMTALLNAVWLRHGRASVSGNGFRYCPTTTLLRRLNGPSNTLDSSRLSRLRMMEVRAIIWLFWMLLLSGSLL